MRKIRTSVVLLLFCILAFKLGQWSVENSWGEGNQYNRPVAEGSASLSPITLVDSAPDSGALRRRMDGDIRWEGDRATVPAEVLHRLSQDAFLPQTGDTWKRINSGSFRLSSDMAGVLGLDREEIAEVEAAFSEIGRPVWSFDRSEILKADGQSVTLALPGLAQSEGNRMREALEARLGGLLGISRAHLLIHKAKTEIDWIYGGFGRYQRIMDICVNEDGDPRGWLTIRESLLLQRESEYEGIEGERSFEFATREYRLDTVPAELQAHIAISEESGRPGAPEGE